MVHRWEANKDVTCANLDSSIAKVVTVNGFSPYLEDHVDDPYCHSLSINGVYNKGHNDFFNNKVSRQVFDGIFKQSL